ncbi:MAG: GAF domain-containing protein, partial [Nitrospira sp.]
MTTLANAMSVALKNAQSFKAEQERVAELQIINSIQQGLAAELNFQGIVDLVGDKLREVLNTGDFSIYWYDEKTKLAHYLYTYEHSRRLEISPRAPTPGGQFETMLRTRQPIVANHAADFERLNIPTVPGTDAARSLISIPIFSSDRVLGGIQIENHERENAFGESEIRLLTTIAASLGTALANARLFDETQRLLKETEESNAELAIITSVQQGLASKLDMQAIYDLVGDKIRQIFDAQVVFISTFDRQTNLNHLKYAIERSKRISVPPLPIRERLQRYLDETHQSVVINRDAIQALSGYGIEVVADTDPPKSLVFVPLIVGSEVKGMISLQNLDHENAFSESDIRLLQTLASSMSVALENARLFDETQRLLKETEQRNAELAVINSIQEGVAAELNFQNIIDLVGDKLREVLQTGEIGIRWYDYENRIVHYLYEYEHGERLTVPPSPSRIGWEIITSSREPRIRNTALEVIEAGNLPGTDSAKSNLAVSIIGSDRVLGSIVIENYEREYAFSPSDVRLLTTVASSMGVALENARLFDETQRLFQAEQQRTAELQIINSIQQGLAAELDFQAIIGLVGDKLRQVLSTGDIGIRWYDEKENLLHYLYEYEHGKRLEIPSHPPEERPIWRKMVETRKPVIWNTAAEGNALSPSFEGTDESKSGVYVPVIVNDRILGNIVLEDYEREYTFGESELRLVTTIAASLGTSLENARLFDETQRLLKETEQRAAELAILNDIGKAMARTLDVKALARTIGDQVREIFSAEIADILLYDSISNMVGLIYSYSGGYFDAEPAWELGEGGLTTRIILSGQPLLLNSAREIEEQGAVAYVTTPPGEPDPQSYLGVPVMVGDRVLGVVDVQSLRPNAFDENNLRLLQTLSSNMGVTLENARLFDEMSRHARESAALTEVGRDISSTLNLSSVMERIAAHARELLRADTSAIFLPESNGTSYKAIVAQGVHAEEIRADTIQAGEGIIGALAQQGKAEFVNDSNNNPRAVQIPGTPADEEERLMVAPLLTGEKVGGMMAVWREAG